MPAARRAARKVRMQRIVLVFWIAALVGLCVPGRAAADAPVEVWQAASGSADAMSMPRGRTVARVLYGRIGLEEGVVMGGGVEGSDIRAPFGLRPLVGFDFFELGTSRVLLGVTLAVPFSLEMGYGHDLSQLAVAPGVSVSRRECANWGWFAGLEIPIVITPERIEGVETEVIPGIGLRGGAAWYFLAGLGIYAEAGLDIYLGTDRAAVLGLAGGLVVSYEMFRFEPATAQGGG